MNFSWLGSVNQGLDGTQGRSQEIYFGVSKTSGASKRQLEVWGRCKPPSWVRGKAPEILANSTLKRPQMAYFWIFKLWNWREGGALDGTTFHLTTLTL